MPEEIKISNRISYFAPSENPLSANVGIIRGDLFLWLFDVGNGRETFNAIQSLPGEKSIVISHFHPDHMGNLQKCSYMNLFVSNNTRKYAHAGTVVSKELSIDDGVNFHILAFPSAHAKGSLALEVNNEYVFLGDALYPTTKNDRPCYNACVVMEQIDYLTKLSAQYVLSSHRTPFVERKEVILTELLHILQKRHKDEPYIFLDE